MTVIPATVTVSHMLFLASISSNFVEQRKSTTYGFSEAYCGDTHRPTPCAHGAVTATGEKFDPTRPTAAIPLPTNIRLRKGFHVNLQHGNGPCVPIWVNDKKNARYRGSHDFDLTPAAVYAITGKKPTKYWSSLEVRVCHSTYSSARKDVEILKNYVSSMLTVIWSVAPYASTSF
jgi:hypothetical protein